jgi:hypothetical protein
MVVNVLPHGDIVAGNLFREIEPIVYEHFVPKVEGSKR